MQEGDKTMSIKGLLMMGAGGNYPNCPSAGERKKYGKVINGTLHRYMHQHT